MKLIYKVLALTAYYKGFHGNDMGGEIVVRHLQIGITCSRFIIHDSLLIIHYFRFQYSRLFGCLQEGGGAIYKKLKKTPLSCDRGVGGLCQTM